MKNNATKYYHQSSYLIGIAYQLIKSIEILLELALHVWRDYRELSNSGLAGTSTGPPSCHSHSWLGPVNIFHNMRFKGAVSVVHPCFKIIRFEGKLWHLTI